MELSFGHKTPAGPGHDAHSEDKKGSGLFGGKKKEEPQLHLGEIQEQVMTVTRRLRVMDEQQTNLRRKLQMVEQNMLSNNKRLGQEIKNVNAEIVDVKRMVAEIENKILLIIKEIKESARKEDVDVLQKYVNMWEPVNFVTRDEVEKMLEEAFQNK